MAQKLGELIDKISIHALREEGDRPAGHPAESPAEFLSTPSARRATPSRHFLLRADAYFYPRPPRGGRRRRVLVDVPDGNDFYPRSPRGGRHKHYIIILSDSSISIHALREEGDR